MHNMGQLEYQNDWGRCWVDLGTSDGVAIDVLINALRQLDSDVVQIEELVVGGVNENWPVEDHPDSVFLPVAERRRLLLSPDRLEQGGSVLLNTEEEQHYLRKCCACACGEQVDLIDGCGKLDRNLMEAKLLELDRPAQLIEPQAQPQLGLAVADAAGDG